MISTRYGIPVAVLLALALVPTVIHSYRGATVTDGLTTASVAVVLDGMRSSPTPRRAGWVKNHLASEDWFERVYRVGNQDVTLFVARSYDGKRLYHHPELALLRGVETSPAGVARSTARPDVPLHVLTTAKGAGKGIGVYALLYDGRFIENPITFQLRTSAELLFSGRKPLTLFMASDLTGRTDRIDDAAATRVLLAAIEAFERQTDASR
jgi:hypothetical protein